MELEFLKDYKQFVIAQTDKDLRYSLIINPHKDFDPNSVLGKKDNELAENEGINKLISLKKEVLKSGKNLRQVISFELSSGIETYDLLAKPIYDNNGNIAGVSTVALNISEHRLTEEAKIDLINKNNIYLREIHHRVKNHLSEIEGFINLQIMKQEIPEADFVLRNTISRIRGIKSIYDTLLTSDNFEAISIEQYLQKLISGIQKLYSHKNNIGIELSCSNFYLPIKEASIIGIIVNELITNAFKYAFNELEKGKILVDLVKIEKQLILTVQDNGIGIDENIIAKGKFGLGYTLIKGLVNVNILDIINNNGTKIILKFNI